jgi:hypothetical protein
MNPSKDLPSNEFNKVFKEWIPRSINGNPQIDLVHLKLHYRVDPLLELDNLNDIVDDSSRNVDFLSNKYGRIFDVFLIMNSLNEDPYVYSQTDKKSVFLSLLSMKIYSKTIICICDQKSFNNLVVT